MPHLPKPVAVLHLNCSLAPITGIHSGNEFPKGLKPRPSYVEHHVGNDPLCLIWERAKGGEDGLAVCQSDIDILCEELLHSCISHPGPNWLPMLWVSGQYKMPNAYNPVSKDIKIDVSPISSGIFYQLVSQCLIIGSDSPYM